MEIPDKLLWERQLRDQLTAMVADGCLDFVDIRRVVAESKLEIEEMKRRDPTWRPRTPEERQMLIKKQVEALGFNYHIQNKG